MKKIIAVTIISLVLVGNSFATLVGNKPISINAKEWINASGPVSLDQFKDKVVVLEFWATWCPPCREAIPHLVKLYNKDKNKGLIVIGLTSEKKSTIMDKFIKKMKMKYIVGTGSTSAQEYNIRGIPHAFVIVDNKIIWEGHPMNGLDQVVEKALRDKAPKAEETKKKEPKVKKEK